VVGEEISVGRALGAGFDLVRRQPGAVAVWVVLYLAIGVAPQYGLAALTGPMVRSLQTTAGQPATSASMLQQVQLFSSVQGVTLLLSLVSQTVLLSAAYRAALFPEERSFFFLRFGARELWLALTLLVLLLGFIVVVFAAMIPAFLVVGISGAVAGPVAGGIFGVLGVFFAFGVVIWVALRMSLAPPMSFAERGFKLFESWRMTRGHALRLFAVAAVLVVMLIVAEAVVGLGGFLLLGGPAKMNQLASAAQDPQLMLSLMGPLIVVFGLLVGALSVVFYVLVGGAWAQIYRELNPKLAEVFS
jgi:hypothetical protein